jgi:hypothetical protein
MPLVGRPPIHGDKCERLLVSQCWQGGLKGVDSRCHGESHQLGYQSFDSIISYTCRYVVDESRAKGRRRGIRKYEIIEIT